MGTGGALGGVVAPSYMATQVDIIGGDRVAQRVVSMLKLDEISASRQRWLDATEGRGSLQAWLAESLQKRLDVRPARESNVINISFKGAEAESTAQIANAFAQAYLDTHLALKTEPARIYAEWFEQQAKAHFPRAKVRAVEKPATGYQEVLAGRAQVTITSNVEASTLMKTYPDLQVVGSSMDMRNKRPFAYPMPQGDHAWVTFVNNWISLKEAEGFFDVLEAKWLVAKK